jgi:4-hydroxy-2-oxoheptanedioate aldolase
MIKNTLKEKWARGQGTINGWLSINSPFVAEIMAEQGYDSVTIDMQHGAVSYEGALGMLQAMRASGVVPMVRVPWNEPGVIMKALDAGAYGIICPMVDTAEDAARLVSYMRYPPYGQRSFGPTRANFSAGAGYATEANNEILCIAMIETARAMENLEEIVATPGLDGVYIGPADLTLGITNGALAPGFDREEPQLLEAIHKIRKAAFDAGIRACIHCGTPEYAARALGWGFNMTTLSNDVRLLASHAEATVNKARALVDANEFAVAPKTAGGY